MDAVTKFIEKFSTEIVITILVWALVIMVLMSAGCSTESFYGKADDLLSACAEGVPHDKAMQDRNCDDAALRFFGPDILAPSTGVGL